MHPQRSQGPRSRGCSIRCTGIWAAHRDNGRTIGRGSSIGRNSPSSSLGNGRTGSSSGRLQGGIVRGRPGCHPGEHASYHTRRVSSSGSDHARHCFRVHR